LAGEFFFSEDVADSPCEAAFYIVPHTSEAMFKIGWGVAADRRLDTINAIWGGQLDIYCALVIATSRKAALHAERTMKLILDGHGWKIDDLPPLEGHSEFYSTDGLLYAHDACITKLLPMMQALEERTHVITARGADETTEQMFGRITSNNAGKLVSPDALLAEMISSKLRPIDIPRIIQAMHWHDYPHAITQALSDAISSKYSKYAPHANDLWLKCGAQLLQQPAQFVKVALPYGTEERNLLNLLGFIETQNVAIKDQSGEFIAEVLSALSAATMAKYAVSKGIEFRQLTFVQRTKALKKLLQEKNREELLTMIAHQLDDLDQLKAEAEEGQALNIRFGKLTMCLHNPQLISHIGAPKNFPGVLATLYFLYFDGLSEKAIIRPSHWPLHEQVHLKTFRLALSGLKMHVVNTGSASVLASVPVFQKALLVAMLDLYGACFAKDEESNSFIKEELAAIGHDGLDKYFDEEASAVFAVIRNELRKAYQHLGALRNGAPAEQLDAALLANIKALQIRLPASEIGTYYAMYAFQDVIAEFGKWVVAPSSQTEEETRPSAIQFIKHLWPLVRDEIVYHHHLFNDLLLYLHAWSAKFELEDVPEAHPQAVY
jgi:hypothetical protein